MKILALLLSLLLPVGFLFFWPGCCGNLAEAGMENIFRTLRRLSRSATRS